MAQKETSFISGLVGGFGQTVMKKQEEQKAMKLKTLGVILDSPDVDDQSKQRALDELVTMGGLSPKGKGAEQFHRTRGFLEGVMKIGKGIQAGAQKMAGMGGGDQGQQGGGWDERVPGMKGQGYPGAYGEEAGFPKIPSRTGDVQGPMGRIPQAGSQSQGQPDLGQVPQRQSPYRFKTREQKLNEEMDVMGRKRGVERYFTQQEEDDRRWAQESERRRREGLLKNYPEVDGAAALEFIEKGNIPSGLVGKVTQGKDAYEAAPGHWVRDLLDRQGRVVGQTPAAPPAPKGPIAQEVQARSESGQSVQDAYKEVLKSIDEKRSAYLRDVNSRIATRGKGGGRGGASSALTGPERARLDVAKREEANLHSQLKSMITTQGKEAPHRGEKREDVQRRHEEEIAALETKIDAAKAEIENIIAGSEQRMGTPPAAAHRGTVKMKTPDGKTWEVPSAQIEAAKKRGAVVVQ